MTRPPVFCALLPPIPASGNRFSTVGPTIAVPAIAFVPVSIDVDSTWADIKSLRLSCCCRARTQCQQRGQCQNTFLHHRPSSKVPRVNGQDVSLFPLRNEQNAEIL